MKYIIENALTNIYGEEQRNSYLIEGSKVMYNANHFSQYNHMRINTDRFVLTPGYAMVDFSILSISHFSSFKERMKHLQSIGCTTLITAFNVFLEHEFRTELKKAKHALINSSIDYLLGAKIPLSKLTPTMVRMCCKHKVPLIFAEIIDPEEINDVNWQWIRGELFPYHTMIVPIWNIPGSKRTLQRFKMEWEQILTVNKITTQIDAPIEHAPLSKQFLLNVGLYPKKGALKVGTDADYLLFSKAELDGDEKDYKDIHPEVVVANGVVKKAGIEVYIQPGVGKELTVAVPRQFTQISHAFQPATIYVDYY
ncbi:MAG: hypothetical protein ACK4M9_15655 [Anaerobacillus sp.]|uniref:hypothetical protein n=1 Tax=Anaerobacillus sp. TaxID=1872506 RepID=UPI00391CBA53